MDRKEFIMNSSMRILEGMMSNPEKDPDPSAAVDYAEELWEELIQKNIVDDDSSPLPMSI